MSTSAPGRHYREGISLMEFFDLFPDEASAEAWFVQQRWPNGIACPKCGSLSIAERKNRKPLPWRCKDCRKDFSVKTGSLMESSKLKLRVWLLAIYILTTNIKGTSSLKLHRDLKVTQKTAWFLAHRIRGAWDRTHTPFGGVVEADESYFGGKERNKHTNKKLHVRGTAGKAIVAGVRDRESGRVRVEVVPDASAPTLQTLVQDSITLDATLYTDELAAYKALPNHDAVKHGVGEYVQEQVHINGMESFWAVMKRGYHGVYHAMSPKHLPRYVAEFEGRHNDRPTDTMTQMERLAQGLDRKRLRYTDLTAKNGLSAIAYEEEAV